MSKIINIKCNANLGKYKKGSVVQVATSESGSPVERFWRNRIRDAEIDNCCEIVEEKKSSKKNDK
jgi:hypothetical protein